MERKRKTGSEAGMAADGNLKNACRASRRKILVRVARATELIFAESRGGLATQERLLRLALNEAEALAWQTTYPHLLFPTLAAEKVQAVVAWNTRQQAVRRTNLIVGFAA